MVLWNLGHTPKIFAPWDLAVSFPDVSAFRRGAFFSIFFGSWLPFIVGDNALGPNSISIDFLFETRLGTANAWA